MAGSEITRFLQQYREEEEAAHRGLYDYQIVSKHQFITARMENMGRCFKALADITGSEEAAMKLIVADQSQQGSTTTIL